MKEGHLLQWCYGARDFGPICGRQHGAPMAKSESA